MEKGIKFKKRFSFTKRKALLWAVGAILIVYCITMLAPCYFMVINSFKTQSEYFNNVWTFPSVFKFDNYAKVSSECSNILGISIWGMYFNSLLITAMCVVFSTVAVTITSYTLARFKFPGRGFLVACGVGAMLIPDLGSGATIYKLYVDLNLIDTGFVLFSAFAPFGMMFLIMYSLFTTVSGTYAEAAKIDGASELRVFIQIMVPMAKGTIGMMAVMTAIGAWNNYYLSYMYLPSCKTLALGMQELAWQVESNAKFPILYASMTLAVIPLMVLFISMRDVIINNAVAGGIKG